MDRLKQKTSLGQTGLKISPLGLGTVKFGRNEGVKYPEGFKIPGEPELADLLSLAQDSGINLLDTAPAYGSSEERLGRLLKRQRKNWVIAGKVGEEFEQGRSHYIFTPDHFETSLHRTLGRLQTDYLDILLIHSDGSDNEILSDGTLIEKMHDFKKRGLVRAIGASTKTAEGGIKTLETLDIVMATYNPLYTEEKPVLDLAAKKNKGVLLKKALASGHLGKLGENPLESALNFAFSHPATNAIIIGTINPQHLAENIRAASKALEQGKKA
ncbi:MAG: aldo/keto reductase [Rhodospirillales bacterium]|nr:aldo/keto reductase [Alphaproteobacteria bacterium]MCB9976716.1 aldo/keto reductase [Rhodospirillales bacterium]